MLPSLPDLPVGQWPILQQWFGLAALLMVVFGMFVSYRKMMREDRKPVEQSPLANMPKYYFEGTIGQAFKLLEGINSNVKALENHVEAIEKKLDDHIKGIDDLIWRLRHRGDDGEPSKRRR